MQGNISSRSKGGSPRIRCQRCTLSAAGLAAATCALLNATAFTRHADTNPLPSDTGLSHNTLDHSLVMQADHAKASWQGHCSSCAQLSLIQQDVCKDACCSFVLHAARLLVCPGPAGRLLHVRQRQALRTAWLQLLEQQPSPAWLFKNWGGKSCSGR
ncbi:hypothetical protein COO60DRAFT_1459122 [Scenedesmus sp. NREL 46B-D3]|nr:hypothetical protein COO60DRAFT_1459122 [Scenedesmus sp. NREL 46B-D3]